MQRPICPYLGQRDDPSTALHFPSEGNACHHARPMSGIRAGHQEKFCLTASHARCPVYLAAAPIPLPKGIAANGAPASAGNRRFLTAVAIPLLIAGTAAASFAWSALQARDSLLRGNIANTGGMDPSQPWSIFEEQGRVAPSTDRTPNAVQPEKICPLPSGWTTYTVAPTDSIYRLSVIYGVSIETLQRANCMGDSTVILPGQVFHVPFLPTREPTLVPVPQGPGQVVIIPASAGGGTAAQPKPQEEPQPRPTRRPPTALPPTPVPPTAVPPIVEPQPKPTQETRPPAKPTQKPDDKDGKDDKGDKKDKKDKDDKKGKDDKGDDRSGQDNGQDRDDRKDRDDKKDRTDRGDKGDKKKRGN